MVSEVTCGGVARKSAKPGGARATKAAGAWCCEGPYQARSPYLSGWKDFFPAFGFRRTSFFIRRMDDCCSLGILRWEGIMGSNEE